MMPITPSNDPHPIDRLTERSRIRGDARVIAEGSGIEVVTEEIAKAVISNVLSYKREKDIPFKFIARGIGVQESTLSQVVNCKYGADARPIILDLDRWVDDQRKIDLAPKPASFVWTSIAREIKSVADAAVELKTIGLIFGPETSGLGKTTALQATAAERPGCIFITVDKVNANVTGILDLIGEKLRIGQMYGNAHRYKRVCEAMNNTSRLLIVDQCHNLCGARKDLPFHALAELHERTKSPQLWAGTSDIIGYLRREQAKGHEPLSQVRSRIGIVRDLTQRARRNGGGDDGGGADGQLFTIDEIRSIFGKNKMRLSPDAARYLLRLANLPDSGALRTCKNLVVMATTIYQSRHEVLTDQLLRSAHQLLVTDENYGLVQAAVEMTESRKVG